MGEKRREEEKLYKLLRGPILNDAPERLRELTGQWAAGGAAPLANNAFRAYLGSCAYRIAERSTTMPLRHCECCGNPYDAKRMWQKFCSVHCRQMVYHHKFAARFPLGTTPPKPTGPTLDQEAEWQRRGEISERWQNDRSLPPEQDIERAKELARQSELLKINRSLEDWLDGKEEDK